MGTISCPINPDALREPLAQMAKARLYAEDLGQEATDFAVELLELRRLGVDDTDLRWLCGRGYFRHLIECTERSSAKRTFVAEAAVHFASRSCFVLTDTGQEFADSLLLSRSNGQAPAKAPANSSGRAVTTPHWDAELGELRASEIIVKRVPSRATNQTRVLCCFEEDGWPARIDDPLVRSQRSDSIDRLHGTVKRLNGNQMHHLIVFGSDGSGEGIYWRWTPDARKHGLTHPWDKQS